MKRYSVDTVVAELDCGTQVVLAADYDAMDAAATALGTHVQHLEAQLIEAVKLLNRVVSDENYGIGLSQDINAFLVKVCK